MGLFIVDFSFEVQNLSLTYKMAQRPALVNRNRPVNPGAGVGGATNFFSRRWRFNPPGIGKRLAAALRQAAALNLKNSGAAPGGGAAAFESAGAGGGGGADFRAIFRYAHPARKFRVRSSLPCLPS